MSPLRTACRYELAAEFGEALEHAVEPGINTKVLLRMADIGETY